MIKAVGIDIVEIPRFKKAIDRWGERFLRRVFTPWEISYCEEKAFPEQSYAARFAVKEAVLKAVGSGFGKNIRWTSIEIVNDREGKPSVKLGKRISELIGSGKILISISHTHRYAVAQAILTED